MGCRHTAICTNLVCTWYRILNWCQVSSAKEAIDQCHCIGLWLSKVFVAIQEFIRYQAFIFQSVGLFCGQITQKVTGRFGWNFRGKLVLARTVEKWHSIGRGFHSPFALLVYIMNYTAWILCADAVGWLVCSGSSASVLFFRRHRLQWYDIQTHQIWVWSIWSGCAAHWFLQPTASIIVVVVVAAVVVVFVVVVK